MRYRPLEFCNGKKASIKRVFTGISVDSRTVRPGDCFFAIEGERLDGHQFVWDAVANGAVCCVVQKDKQLDNIKETALLRVSDTTRALGKFAGHYRRKHDFKCVAITGSVGKTTTRRIVSYVLADKFRLTEAPKNFNNQIGVPLTLLKANPDDEIIVAELGANKPGEIEYLSLVVEPDIALITNAKPSHLRGLANLQTIINEKAAIASHLRPNGVLFADANCSKLLQACRTYNIEPVTFGTTAQSDINAADIACSASASTFTIEGKQLFLPLPGFGNVENAVAAWAICQHLGVTIDEFARRLKTTLPISMRNELLEVGQLTILNDCYNANPASMQNALDTLTRLERKPGSRLVFICGAMAELGGQSEKLHAELGRQIARAEIDLLVAIGESSEIVTRSAINSAEHILQVHIFADVDSACNELHNFIQNADIILVKGSREARLESAVEKLKELFLPAVTGKSQHGE